MAIDIEREAREIEKELEKGELPEPRRLPKVAIALFLAFLMVTYILVDPTVRGVLIGFFESSQVEGDSFRYGEKTITFQGNLYPRLVGVWESNQEAEIRVCLQGRLDGDDYEVTGILFPKIYSRHVFQVVSGPCPANTIIDLHTHPPQHCVASDTDLKLLEREKEQNPDLLMAVMCSEDRISFYG